MSLMNELEEILKKARAFDEICRLFRIATNNDSLSATMSSVLENFEMPSPDWLNAPLIFTEDRERMPTETVHTAWLRLFGVFKTNEELVDKFMNGDSSAFLYKSGRVFVAKRSGFDEIRLAAKGK